MAKGRVPAGTLALRRGVVGRRWIEEHRLKRMLQKALARKPALQRDERAASEGGPYKTEREKEEKWRRSRVRWMRN